MDDNKVSTETPTPGSDEAIALGCCCPVLDNGHGRGRGDGTFWVIEGCPLHGKFAIAALQNARKKAGLTCPAPEKDGKE